MRTAAWFISLVIAGLALVIGCLAPVADVQASSPIPASGGLSGGGMWERHYGVVWCALASGDESETDGVTVAGVGAARWPARLVLLAAPAAFWLALTRRRRAAAIACGTLALSVAWLFLALAAHPPEEVFEYAPLSAFRSGDWTSWFLLVAGTLLLAAATWLGGDRRRATTSP